jgi:hypothetical protein
MIYRGGIDNPYSGNIDLLGSTGNDVVRIGGSTVLEMGSGNDLALADGEAGLDYVTGGSGSDTIVGLQGNDTIDGTNGNGDVLVSEKITNTRVGQRHVYDLRPRDGRGCQRGGLPREVAEGHHGPAPLGTSIISGVNAVKPQNPADRPLASTFTSSIASGVGALSRSISFHRRVRAGLADKSGSFVPARPPLRRQRVPGKGKEAGKFERGVGVLFNDVKGKVVGPAETPDGGGKKEGGSKRGAVDHQQGRCHQADQQQKNRLEVQPAWISNVSEHEETLPAAMARVVTGLMPPPD